MNIARVLSIAALLLSVPTGSAVRGQSQPPRPLDLLSAHSDEVVMVSLPEEVFLTNAKIPAVEYQIRFESEGAMPLLLFTSSGRADKKVPVSIVPTPNGKPAERTEVVLEKVGSSVYLTKIWKETSTTGYDLGLTGLAGDLQRQPYKTIPASLFPPPGSRAVEIENEAHATSLEERRQAGKPEEHPADTPPK